MINTKKRHIGKKIILTLTIFVCTMFNTQSVSADANTGNELFCQRDWATFISSVISYDGFTEYWKDIFYRYNKNICYYTDIDNVMMQLDKAREQIRKAFFDCSAARAIQIRDRYYELESELFFLRNFVDISKSEIKDISDKKVYEALRNNFVINKSYFTEDKTLELFDKFKQKYESRVKNVYNKCEDPGLTALMNKFKSLRESFKAMGGTGKSLKEEWNKSINTPVKRTGNFLNGFLDQRINNLPPKKAIDQLVNELAQKLPENTQPTLENVHNVISKNEEAYTEKVQSANIMAEYEALYKKGSDNIAKDFEAKLKELDALIKGTYPALDSLKECAKTSKEKQCKG